MKGPPAVARGGLQAPRFQFTPSCEANAGCCSVSTQNSEGTRAPCFLSEEGSEAD